MYDDHRYGRYARANRWKAAFLTVLFHALIIGGIAFHNQHDLKKYLPDTVKDMLGLEVEKAEDIVRP